MSEKKLGRPNIYDPEELAQQLNIYIDKTKDPRIEEFCLPIGAPHKETLYHLSKECKNLSDAITRAKYKRNLYLTGEDCPIHPKIIGIRLNCDQGMNEKISNEITGANGADLTINIKVSDD